jgi:hypothetical protein
MGPSVGWVDLPGTNPFPITAAGTYQLSADTSLVTVSVAGAVIIILPSAQDPGVPAGAQPGLYAKTPITIVDIGGNGQSHPITIEPFAGNGDTIMGLDSITINSNYGAYTLKPSNAQKGWTNISP